jgi:hypothetical protein
MNEPFEFGKRRDYEVKGIEHGVNAEVRGF